MKEENVRQAIAAVSGKIPQEKLMYFKNKLAATDDGRRSPCAGGFRWRMPRHNPTLIYIRKTYRFLTSTDRMPCRHFPALSAMRRIFRRTFGTVARTAAGTAVRTASQRQTLSGHRSVFRKYMKPRKYG